MNPSAKLDVANAADFRAIVANGTRDGQRKKRVLQAMAHVSSPTDAVARFSEIFGSFNFRLLNPAGMQRATALIVDYSIEALKEHYSDPPPT